MKFKKVEIQAFRAYNEVGDGTFDFSIGNSQNADLIGIYAPNGFGKTSFYDAVEWGVTKNIHRLLKKHKFNIEHAKSERNINGKAKQYILRNRFAKDETPGYVQLFTTNSAKPLKRDIVLPRAGSVDYKFKDTDTINRYFQKVILSQEWIDAFLKEDDAAARYETFIEYFGNGQLDAYRKKLVELLMATDKQIEDLKERLKGVQKELDFSGDQNILKNLNGRITALQTVYPALKIIETEFTETDFVNFKNQLTELLQGLRNRVIVNNSFLAKYTRLLNGDEQLLGIERYEKAKKELTTLQQQIKQIENLLKDFQSQAASDNKLRSNLREQISQATKQQGIAEIIGKFPIYLQLAQDRITNGDQTKIKQEELRAKQQALQAAQSQLKELELQQKSLQRSLTDIDQQLRTTSEKQAGQVTYEAEYLKLSRQSADQLEKIKSISAGITARQNTVERLAATIKDINQDKFPSGEHEAYKRYQQVLLALNEGKNEHDRLQKEVAALNRLITERETFNQEIQRFVTLGAEIVDKDQLSICPLCSHDHEEYQLLAQRIAGNNLLSDALQGLLAQKTLLEQATAVNETAAKKNKVDLVNMLGNERKEAEKQLGELRPQQLEAAQAQKVADDAIEELNKTRLEFTSLLGNLTFDDYRTLLNKRLSETNTNLAALKGQIESLQTTIRGHLLEIETINATLESLSAQLKTLTLNETYRVVLQYFEKNYPGVTPTKELLDQELLKIKLIVDSLKSEASELEIQQKALSLALDSHQKDQVNANLKLLTAQQKTLEQQINTFEFYAKNDCGIDQITKAAIEAAILKVQLSLVEDDRLTNEITLIQQQLENILPYLRFEKAKVSFDELKIRISFMENTLKKELEKERKKVGEHLHNEIKAFFYEDLINELYAKIDPHPDYKKIKFMCDFKEDKPKLNVCVCTEGKDELLIPNLYFSTAQLNILSLSIFLAKALNVQDDNKVPVDCIFIDDPIQSMDSINILSTIDLIRSLVVNYEKQIIISTHDENFYNLLQKKIPAGLFKSKFIELETFGKVKTQPN
ncbi:MAG: ATPase involved in repair [Mucilaginibacter sp.]|uniref:AAA family ATPase n=1 Tax=Mucilaginibacter sp. TaxID=1882438 RepID=UPI00260BDBD6|nr:AAA family ATPase [Mucilaginibacter sp.]MDB5004385.1 ATPase involved in repair [Mucilaginibacter sp.]